MLMTLVSLLVVMTSFTLVFAESGRLASASAGTSSKELKIEGYSAYIRSVNRNVSPAKARKMAKYFYTYGKKYRVSPTLLMAMAQCESTFYENAHNPSGYYGLMQTTSTLGRKYAGVSGRGLLKAKNSIKTGAGYLAYNKKILKSNYKAVAGYMCGTGAVLRGRYNRAGARRRIAISGNINDFLEDNGYVD